MRRPVGSGQESARSRAGRLSGSRIEIGATHGPLRQETLADSLSLASSSPPGKCERICTTPSAASDSARIFMHYISHQLISIARWALRARLVNRMYIARAVAALGMMNLPS